MRHRAPRVAMCSRAVAEGRELANSRLPRRHRLQLTAATRSIASMMMMMMMTTTTMGRTRGLLSLASSKQLRAPSRLPRRRASHHRRNEPGPFARSNTIRHHKHKHNKRHQRNLTSNLKHNNNDNCNNKRKKAPVLVLESRLDCDHVRARLNRLRRATQPGCARFRLSRARRRKRAPRGNIASGRWFIAATRETTKTSLAAAQIPTPTPTTTTRWTAVTTRRSQPFRTAPRVPHEPRPTVPTSRAMPPITRTRICAPAIERH